MNNCVLFYREIKGIWMNVDKKDQDDLLTKVLREPFVFHTPTVKPPSEENEPQTSHYDYQFDEKDYLSK